MSYNFSTCTNFSFIQGFALGWQQDRVPWKQIKEHTAELIDPIYLPTNSGDQVVQLEDPSNMNKEQIVVLLEHWTRSVPIQPCFGEWKEWGNGACTV